MKTVEDARYFFLQQGEVRFLGKQPPAGRFCDSDECIVAISLRGENPRLIESIANGDPSKPARMFAKLAFTDPRVESVILGRQIGFMEGSPGKTLYRGIERYER